MTDLEFHIKHFFGVKPNELQCLTSKFIEHSLPRNSTYLKLGHFCDKLSFIKTGYIRIFTEFNDKEVTQWIATPGYFVTDLASFAFDTTARFTIEALSDVELYTLSKADYHSLGKELPKWHEIEKKFISKCFIMLEDRIFQHLSLSAEELYIAFFENNRQLFREVPLQYIASMLGMTPETFSRVRKKMLH